MSTSQSYSKEQFIKLNAEPFESLNDANLNGLMDRIGDARIVLIGEASHGTSEFYLMRQKITQTLIQQKGFNIVSVEADWPDAEHVDEYVRLRNPKIHRTRDAFSRFPIWMWRNQEVLKFVEWLREHNSKIDDVHERVSFHGLDLYSLYSSIHEVIKYLEKHDLELCEIAKTRYGCLLPFEPDPEDYGRAVVVGRYKKCEKEVALMLTDLLKKRLSSSKSEIDAIFDAEQNARVVANAERYYRIMYYGGRESWNVRDRHMFETLQNLLEINGPDSKIVVWAHNSHVGDASATEMTARGEINIGYLVRKEYKDQSYIIGFGTHTGTVAAADNWGETVKIKKVKPSIKDSVENLCHQSGVKNFILPLKKLAQSENINAWKDPLLERAIGVIYRPHSERVSHYFDTVLPLQFDEYIWFDTTHALKILEKSHAPNLPARHPFLYGD